MEPSLITDRQAQRAVALWPILPMAFESSDDIDLGSSSHAFCRKVGLTIVEVSVSEMRTDNSGFDLNWKLPVDSLKPVTAWLLTGSQWCKHE